jgi:hypothetical protein
LRHPSERAGAALVRPARLIYALATVGALALALSYGLPGPGASRASAQPAPAQPTPQTDASIPAHKVTMIGATPLEAGAPGRYETWGVGTPVGNEGAGAVLVGYDFDEQAHEGVWSLGPGLLDASGQPLSHFKLDGGPLAGQMTPDGAGVLVGEVPSGTGTQGERQVVLVRKPGGAFAETSPLPSEGEGSLGEGQALFGTRAPLLAPLDEGAGEAGALLVPVSEKKGLESQVLHWDGKRWTSEAIEIPKASREDFHVLAIGASSPANAWLLAQLSSKSSYPPGAVALFRRVPLSSGAGFSWKPVALGGSADEEAHPLTVPVTEGSAPLLTVPGSGEPPTVQAQILTVTSQGVWIDGERSDVKASTTLFFKPREESAGEHTAGEHAAEGDVVGSWCTQPAAPPCQHELPEALPTGPSRSIAWASGATFGERVITGLPDGVSLRLEGESFQRVLSLGAGKGAQEDPGAQFGAAFSQATEGWLGVGGLPIHLTPQPAPTKLTPWPAPFRHALIAIAPQPGVPVGSLSSQALVVGDLGEVARYRPGQGWLPESLLGPSGRVETPRLRAVAWPTPTRAYAVGDYGEMWLWRGETGLWERDPATPINFRGNLLGIAFDPSNPARGYAVGSSAVGLGGVLLRYGKTWTQEQALPPQVQGASFTSIAFAGSEAIVAYRMLANRGEASYVGGLLVNDGSGWQVDQGAAAAIGAGAPESVAALSDGGAAFAASSREGTRVFERESAGAPWQPVSAQLPRGGAGSLALFREGGALRAIVSSGGAGSNIANEREIPAPPGFPPNLIGPYELGGSGPEGSLLRQTAGGWSDQTHELDPLGEPGGLYVHWDIPYRQEPILGVLVDPSGTQGWAIGGQVNSGEPRLETAAIDRYPADGVAPLGVGVAPVSLEPGEATFAIGGGAQCATPCAGSALAGIGPDVWLSTALARAGQIGARAFLYTGPRLTSGETETKEPPVIDYGRELERYAQLLSSSPIPALAAPSPQDLSSRPLGLGQGVEATFLREFAGFPREFGVGEPAQGACAQTAGCEAGYYAVDSKGAGGAVRVIVLDDSSGGDVSEPQLQWLAAELEGAKRLGEPAIVSGYADINAQIQAGDAQAARVAQELVGGGASAYFYYAPEENVTKPLQVGGESIPTFGSGTLGYVDVIKERFGDFAGASGFVLGQVNVNRRNPLNNRAPVTVSLIPDIGELALEATEGILLHRSNPALFDALARRPRAGNRAALGGSEQPEVDPYIPIPSNCVGTACAQVLLPQYTFSSSRPDIGDFVEPNLASSEHDAVLQGPEGKPIPDPESGLFCPYNAGTTIVTISAGGLSSSLPVTVQAGSVRQPCGTTRLKELPAVSQQAAVVPPPVPAPAPAAAPPASAPPALPVPPPPPLAVTPPPASRPPAPAPPPAPFFIQPAPPFLVPAFVPPPLPAPAEPTPPTGTSAVTSPVEAAQKEEEEEEATESVSNQALAYRAPEHEPSPAYVLGVVVLAAFAGASIRRRRPRGGRRGVRVAPATMTSMRAQRRMAVDPRRRR